jgi:phage protein D
VITTLAPRFPESGPPTLAVTALDSLVKLRDRKPKSTDVKKFEKKSDSDIAAVIASRNNLKFKSDSSGRQDDIVAQGDLDEVRFLKFLAARNDFDCFIGVDPDSGDETLFFKKPTDGREGGRIREYVFEWGKSLINFTPTLSIAEQVSTVTVRGWNPRTKEGISYTATKDDLPSGGGEKNGPKAVEDALGPKGDVIVNHPVTTGQEAQDLAISLLRERANKFVKGSGQVIGLPDLRPGDNVQLSGLGKRFSGRYYVTKVEHTLGSSGYLTQFEGELRNGDPNSGPKA